MADRLIKKIFLVVFIASIFVPLLTTNLKDGTVSSAENRTLAEKAKLYNDDGTINTNFTDDFEEWFDDNVGLRSSMVLANAMIQFYVFDILSNNSDYYLGPNGELNYATSAMLTDYQHLNLYSEETLEQIAGAYQTVSDYLEDMGIQFYYFQCWDKHSIYPEYFPNTVLQNGDVSKTDQIIEALENQTTINLISPKQELIAAKDQYDTYSVWGDATHWTQRGAFIGYTLLMEKINENNSGKYKILTEEDYNITISDQGSTLFGGIHKVDYLEDFEIIDPQAYLSDEEPYYVSSWATNSRQVYYNDNAGNDDTLLIFGDSYIDSFLYDDLAESFYRVVMVRDYLDNMIEVVEYYDPDIVIVENAERTDRSHSILTVAEKILAE